MLHGPKSTQHRAATLRQSMTLPEVLLWRALRQRPSGLKFRRQHPAGPYILEFFCAEEKLAIEVDGKAHDMSDCPEHDAVRDAYIARHGVLTLRFLASTILRDLDGVIAAILAAAPPAASYPSTGFAGPPPLSGEDAGAATPPAGPACTPPGPPA